jgi:small subunit ribosomal protein S6
VREYETTVIVQPEISSEGTESILQKMDSVLEGSGSTRLMCADLGKRKLAYEIDKFQKGHYYVLSFLDDGKVVGELERNLRIEESVLRFMTVKVTDEVSDIEVRKEEARIAEAEQQKRAAEKAAREAEEAAAREEVERQAAEEARKQAEAESAAADSADAGASEEAAASESASDDASSADADADSADEETRS